MLNVPLRDSMADLGVSSFITNTMGKKIQCIRLGFLKVHLVDLVGTRPPRESIHNDLQYRERLLLRKKED